MITARYLPTAKNAQVSEFYEKCGFTCVNASEDGSKTYSLSLVNVDFTIKELYHINVK